MSDPLDALRPLREEDVHELTREHEGEGAQPLAYDVYRDGQELVMEFDAPGVVPADIALVVEGRTVDVSLGRTLAHGRGIDVIEAGRQHGTFRRRLWLGDRWDTDRLSARAENGVLTVRGAPRRSCTSARHTRGVAPVARTRRDVVEQRVGHRVTRSGLRARGRPGGVTASDAATRRAKTAAKAKPRGGPAQIESVIGWRVRSRAKEIGLSSAELAKRVGLSRAMISRIENAQVSPSLATISRLAEALEVPITSLFQGLDEERDALFTRAGGGPELGRPGTRSGHRYQLLGSMRGPAKRMEPMLVTLTSESEVFPLYQHPGTEFLYMLEGEMDYGYAGASYQLTPGDSLQFDGEVAHGPLRLGRLPVVFLSVRSYGPPPG